MTEFALLTDKLLTAVILPASLGIILVTVAFILAAFSWRRTGLSILAGGLLVFWFFGSPVIANGLLGTIERQHPAQAAEACGRADIAILLGGALRLPKAAGAQVGLSASSDRILQAARLFRLGRVEHIVVTAGNVPWGAQQPEAERIRELLITWGVAEDRIVIETKSRNTRENALGVRDLQPPVAWRTALLITSSSHMPRALATFQKLGLTMLPCATDAHAWPPEPWDIFDWIPNGDALDKSARAIREALGILVYRWRGWA